MEEREGVQQHLQEEMVEREVVQHLLQEEMEEREGVQQHLQEEMVEGEVVQELLQRIHGQDGGIHRQTKDGGMVVDMEQGQLLSPNWNGRSSVVYFIFVV